MELWMLFLSALASILTTVNALPEINVVGQYFRNPLNNGSFQIIGVSYTLSNATTLVQQDALSNPEACVRDAALLQKAGVNTIHVYALDPTLSHDLCASIFNSVGIYMMISLSWNNTDPVAAKNTTTSYTLDYLQGTFAVIDAVKDYENVLGFFVGDDVSFYQETWSVIPLYIRALVRDAKSYIARNSARAIPVGVSINLDLGNTDPYYQNYYNSYLQDAWEWAQCTTTPSDPYSDISRADFFGISNFDWCPGNGTDGGTNGTFVQQYNVSGWEDLQSNYSGTSIPIFFSDYGCINDVKPQNRDFLEVSALYDPEYMASVFSGGIVTQWANVESTEPGYDFGLTLLDADGNVQLRKDYDTYSRALGQFDLPLLGDGYDAIDTISGLETPATCAPTLVTDPYTLSFASDFAAVPTRPPGAEELIQYGNNGTRGQLVDVTSTQVSQTVKDSNGKVISNLAITPSPSSPRTTTDSITSTLNSNSGSTPTSTLTTPPNSSNKAVAIGAGVGVSLGVLFLAGLGFLLFWCVRRHRNKRTSTVGNHDGIAVTSGEKIPNVNSSPAYYHPVAPEEYDRHDAMIPEEYDRHDAMMPEEYDRHDSMIPVKHDRHGPVSPEEHDEYAPTELGSPESGMPEMDTEYHGAETRGFQK